MRAFTLPLSLSLSFILFLSFTSSCLFVMLSLGAITFLRNALKNIYFDPQQWFWQRQTHLLGHFVCLLREVYTPPHNLFALCRAEFFLSLFFRQIPRLSLIHSHHIYIFHEFSNNINIWHMRHSFNVSFWQFNFFFLSFFDTMTFFFIFLEVGKSSHCLLAFVIIDFDLSADFVFTRIEWKWNNKNNLCRELNIVAHIKSHTCVKRWVCSLFIHVTGNLCDFYENQPKELGSLRIFFGFIFPPWNYSAWV